MKALGLAAVMVMGLASGCGKGVADSSSSTEDTSASGAAASAAGGTLSDSSASGTFAIQSRTVRVMNSCELALGFIFPSAQATNSCPTFATTGAGCTTTGASMWLTDSNCTYGSGVATWNGTKLLKMSTGSASCGTFPNPGNSATLIRQFVTGASSTTPGALTRTNVLGTTVTLDDATANVGNFDNQTIATLANGGYGTQTTFNGSGARSSITINRREYVSGRFDHSVAGSLTVTEASSGSTSRTLSGTITVYHNLLKVVGSSVFNNVTHSNGCCLPVSGSITTTFAAGANVSPTLLGAKVVGKSEILTFTGCGTGTLQAADGSSASVTLNNCF